MAADTRKEVARANPDIQVYCSPRLQFLIARMKGGKYRSVLFWSQPHRIGNHCRGVNKVHCEKIELVRNRSLTNDAAALQGLII